MWPRSLSAEYRCRQALEYGRDQRNCDCYVAGLKNRHAMAVIVEHAHFSHRGIAFSLTSLRPKPISSEEKRTLGEFFGTHCEAYITEKEVFQRKLYSLLLILVIAHLLY